MKCISVQQPWAHAIVHGPKRIENRTWSTHHRGELAIHASAKGRPREDWLFVESIWPGISRDKRPQFGAIIGLCRIVDCVGVFEAKVKYPAQAQWINDDEDTVCFVLDAVRSLRTPVFMPGKLGLFDLDDVTASLVRRQVSGGAR